MTEFEALSANQIPKRFYRGGHRIDDFRGRPRGDDFRPEDWIASTTPLSGEEVLGLSTLSGGESLLDAVEADPIGWLGPEHVRAFGTSTMLLVKLLDAGQRLPVHAHPDDVFAHSVLRRANGKAEAWYILSPGEVHIGLNRPFSQNELLALVTAQDVPALLGALHTRSVEPGDTVFVPAGELHAIGADILLLEIQQPADLSILLEWQGFDLDGLRDGHLGLGFDSALRAISLTARTPEEVDSLIARGPTQGSVLVPRADPYFRMQRVAIDGTVTIEPGFAVMVGENGSLAAKPWKGDSLIVERGTTTLLPHAAGQVTLTGKGSILVCRPPAFAHGPGLHNASPV